MPFEGSPFRQAGTILHCVIQAVGVLPLDLLVRTAEQLDERLAMGDGFVCDMLERTRCCMKPITLERIHKAEEDWHVAQISYRAQIPELDR